ncbi:MAG: bacteriohemerythrin [Candidatus Omnitrophota bacterium]
MIAWKDEYSTGMLDIDAQHKILINYINNLEEIILSQKYSVVCVSNILDYLGSYGKNHFHYEEKCMTEKHCPVAEQNKSEHDKFVKQLATYFERLKNEKNLAVFVKDLHDWTNEWLLDHICKVDTKLRECVHNKNF